MEASPAIDVAKQTPMSGGLILAVGTITGFVGRVIKVPDIALFLLVGMAIGPAALGLINVKADSALYLARRTGGFVEKSLEMQLQQGGFLNGYQCQL